MIPRLKATTFALGGRPVLVASPDTGHYGSLAIEMLTALAFARRDGAAVYFVRRAATGWDGLFELESTDVPILRPSAATAAVLRAGAAVGGVTHAFGEWRAAAAAAARHELHRELGPVINSGRTPGSARYELRAFRHRLREHGDAVTRAREERAAYLQRRLLRSPIAVRLRPEAQADAQRQAAALGIAADASIVCIHARESDVARARRFLPTHREKGGDGADERSRNARIHTYVAACDMLVARGFTVVRLGHAAMTPLTHAGIVDLATSPARTSLLETWCLLRSTLVITGESGVADVSYLTNTPRLLVNATEPFASYPIRAPGLMLPRPAIDRRTGDRVTPAEQLGLEYHRRYRDPRRYQYLDNSPDEILAATHEMLDWMNGRWAESVAQRAYHDAVLTAAAELRPESTYLRMLGPDGGFIGDGRIARQAVEGAA